MTGLRQAARHPRKTLRRWREHEDDYEDTLTPARADPPEPDDRPIEHHPCSECETGIVVDGTCQACGLYF